MRRIMFVLVFMIGICLSGEAKESGIKLIPVYEKTFEDTIVDVIFDTVTVTLKEAKAMGWKEEAFSEEEKARGRVKIDYAKIIIFKKKTREYIGFFDWRGKEVKKYITKPDAIALVSLNGKFIGITTPIECSKGECETRFTMMTDKGDVIWEIEGLGTGPYEPSPDGKWAIGLPSVEVAEAPLEIYNKNGLFKKIENPYGIIEYCFSNDGEYLAISVGESSVWWNPEGYLMWMNSSGEIIWKAENLNVWNMYFSPGSKYLCFKSAKDSVSMILNVFRIANRTNIANFGLGKGKLYYFFPSNENNLLVANGIEKRLYLLNIVENKIRWQVNMKEGTPRTVMATEGLDKIVVGAYPNKVYIFDKNGELLVDETLPERFFMRWPRLKISQDGKRIIYAGRSGKLVAKMLKGGE